MLKRTVDRSGNDPVWPHVFTPIDGKPRWSYVIECKCGATEQTPVRSNADNDKISVEITRRFTKLGWTKIASTGRGLCPDCSKSHKPTGDNAMAPLPKTANIPQLSVVETASPMRSPAAVAKMTDLYLSLGEYYDPQLKEYKKGYSDARIAKELGMAEEFVRQRREMDFGPLVPKVDHIAKIADAFAALEKLKMTGTVTLAEVSGRIAHMEPAFAYLKQVIEEARAAGKGVC